MSASRNRWWEQKQLFITVHEDIRFWMMLHIPGKYVTIAESVGIVVV